MSFVKATPYARRLAEKYNMDLAAAVPTGPDGAVKGRDVLAARDARVKNRRVPVTPLARRMAESMNISLEGIAGTGIGGKISKKDILSAAGEKRQELMPGELRVPLSGMRRSAAAHLTVAARVPTSTVTTKADVTALTEMRLHFNETHDFHVTIGDLVTMAAAKALKKNKRMMCSFDTDSIIYKNEVNIGIAVAVPEGLIVPVLRNAADLGIRDFAVRAHALIKKAREKKLDKRDLAGGVFTVTNLGMFGVEAFTPMLNLPQAAIMGVCAIYDGVTVRNGMAEVRKLVHICTTFDHRALDGADAARFNLAVREFLENPESLFL